MPGIRQVMHWLLLGLCIIASILLGARTWQPKLLFGDASWPEVFWVGLATLTSLAALGRQLPVQNVVATALVILLSMGALEALMPSIGFSAAEAQKQSSIGMRFWLGPWIWLIVLLNARGVARYALRPWHSGANYGFAVLGLATLVAILIQGMLEPMLTHHGYDQSAVSVDTASGPGILIYAAGAALTLAVVTPFLINKRPVEERPPVAPVIVWGVLTFVCLTLAMSHQRWFGVAVIAGQAILMALLILLGRRRCRVDQPLATTS